jgi:ATP-binding protein involved in chromosome partitioning
MKKDNLTLQDFIKPKISSLNGVKKILAISSTKGGVGKSTFTCNLAFLLKEMGYKIAIVDADIYGPSIPTLMKIDQKPEVKDQMILPIIKEEIKCMSIGLITKSSEAGIWRGPMVTKILHQLIQMVNWKSDGNDVDLMIIDMPPGTGDVYLSLAEKFPLDGVVIISTPHQLSIADVIKSIDCFKKLKIPIFGIVQNMAYLEIDGQKKFIFGNDGAKKLAQDSQIEFLGDIPIFDHNISEKENVIVIKSQQKAFEIFKEIADKILKNFPRLLF